MTNTVASAPQTKGRLIHWASSYDMLIHVLTVGRSARFRKRLADLVAAQVGDVLLDVGCGTGDLAMRLAKQVGPTGSVTGIDAAPEMIARARQKARRQRRALDFRVEPVEALSFPNQTFDGVVSSLVFHHLPGDLKQQALQSIARVLKPGGKVTIIDFMSPTGQMSGHAGDAEGLSFTTFLQDAGFVEVTSGPLRFRMLSIGVGMPALGYAVGRTPQI
jgi:ubiquinone/menaquinone biosynthesis C-methylase UbiE